MSATPSDWCRAFAIQLVGDPPRGWCDQTAPAWSTPLPIEDFYRRACRSKLAEGYSPSGWAALMDAAHTAEDRSRRTGSRWFIHFDRDFGTLLADGEQVHLPGPVVAFNVEPRPLDQAYGQRELNPCVITPPWTPSYMIGIRIAPRPPDTYTLVDGTRIEEGAGEYAVTCPTCGTEQTADV